MFASKLCHPGYVLATAHLIRYHYIIVSACDPAFDTCEFKNSITVEFDEEHNYLLEDKDAMRSFAVITRMWVNEQSLCDGMKDVYWEFFFDTKDKLEKENPGRRTTSGTGKGMAKGRNAPRKRVVSYPKKKEFSFRRNNPCDNTLFDELKEANPDDFGDINFLSVELSNGEEYQDLIYNPCRPEKTDTCQRSAVEEVLTALGVTCTLDTDNTES